MKERQTTKFERGRVFDFRNPNTIRLNPALAKEIGLNESIVILQLEFLLAVGGRQVEGHHWVYESITDLQNYLGFLSPTTINRAIKSLESQNLIHIGNFNKAKYDRTRWFRFNFDELAKLTSVTIRKGAETSFQCDEAPPKSGDCVNQDGAYETQSDRGSNQYDTTIPDTSSKTSSNTSSENSDTGITDHNYVDSLEKQEEFFYDEQYDDDDPFID